MQGQTEINLESISPTIRAEHHGNIEFRRLSLENSGKNLVELNLGLKDFIKTGTDEGHNKDLGESKLKDKTKIKRNIN